MRDFLRLISRDTALIFYGLVFAAFAFTSCAFVQKVRESDAPTCAEVQEHLTTVGCFDSLTCKEIVNKVIKDRIMSVIPMGVPFSDGCDLALKTGVIPVDCAMAADDLGDLMDCVDKLPQI